MICFSIIIIFNNFLFFLLKSLLICHKRCWFYIIFFQFGFLFNSVIIMMIVTRIRSFFFSWLKNLSFYLWLKNMILFSTYHLLIIFKCNYIWINIISWSRIILYNIIITSIFVFLLLSTVDPNLPSNPIFILFNNLSSIFTFGLYCPGPGTISLFYYWHFFSTHKKGAYV